MKPSRIRSLAIAWVAACALVAGCAPAPVTPDRFYRLVPPEPAALPAPLLPGTLLVKRFAADGLVGQSPVVYALSNAPSALYQHSYHFWADPPPTMLQSVMTHALRVAGVAREVVNPEHGLDADYQLIGRVRRLEQLLGDAPAVVVALEIGVIGPDRRAPLLLREFEVTLPVADASVEAAAKAMGDATGRILTDFLAGLPGP